MDAARFVIRANGLDAEATDSLVRLGREFGPKRGLYGARITGGGSGGTVAILARSDAISGIEALAERYQGATGRGPTIFSGTGPGAAANPPVKLGPGFVS